MGTILSLQRKRFLEGGRLANGRKVNKNCKLQRVWVWPLEVEEEIKKLMRGYSLNVCAGASPLGDVKIDIEPISSAVQKGRMEDLPFPDNTFDTVISDPPWKMNFFKRMLPFFEVVRVCKVGGRIIYNSTWKPVSKFVKLEEAILRTDNSWCNVSVIWVFEKIAC